MTGKRTILIAGMGTSFGFANAETLVPQQGNLVTFPRGRMVVLNSACMFDGIISGW